MQWRRETTTEVERAGNPQLRAMPRLTNDVVRRWLCREPSTLQAVLRQLHGGRLYILSSSNPPAAECQFFFLLLSCRLAHARKDPPSVDVRYAARHDIERIVGMEGPFDGER